MPDGAPARQPVAGRIPDWWFPAAFVQRFPDGRPLAGGGFVLGVSLYSIAVVLTTLFDSAGADVRGVLLDLTGQHMMVVAPALLIAVLVSGNRSTAERRLLDDWTLVGISVLAAIVVVLAAIGLVVQITEWSSAWGTFDGLLIRAGAGISALASGLWALGRLYEARAEERAAASPSPPA